MLPKSKRIRIKEFTQIKKGSITNTPYFDIKISKGNTLKVACVVTVKRFKSAVVRNKIRRKIYALAEEVLKERVGFFIFYPKQQITHATHMILKETLLSLL